VSLFEELSARQLTALRQNGQLSARDLVQSAVDAIDSANPRVSALVTVTAEQALVRAALMDEGAIERGILWGLPFADKDLTDRAGVVTGAGSRTRGNAGVATRTDPVPQALDNAGGISVGKSAVCEFGLTSYTQSQVFPPTLNPYSLTHGSGGSSGGAAAAVASGMVPFAPGSDGGGSVRIPAWTCGVVGVKPSRGLLPTGSGFDSLGGLVVPGPIAQSVGDAAFLLEAMAGSGPTFKATGHPPAEESFVEAADRDPGVLRIGVTTASPWDNWMDIECHPEALVALQHAQSVAAACGHDVVDLGWEPMPGYAEAFYTLWQASAVSLDIPESDYDLLEPMTRHLVELGQRLGARDLAGALAHLQRFETATIRAFDAVDVVLTPGLATLAPEVGFYATDDPERNFRQQVAVTPFSSFVNVCGLPAVALPVSLSTGGLPLGVQLIGRPGRDRQILSLAAQLEGALAWRGTRPPALG
jgi:amidase